MPLTTLKNFIVYSDGWGYQNRNAVLGNALLNLTKLHNITILQKYVEKVHTQMEADSVHSQIERKVRNLTINVPADYVLAMKKARRNPEPYSVNYVDYKFFKNYEKSISYFKSIRPGKKVGYPCVHDLRALKYTSQGVQYKLRLITSGKTSLFVP